MITLADGKKFKGTLVGGGASGEVVFNTAMLGFEETLTDPSYAVQVLVFSAPHVGNTPVTGEQQESARVHPRAVVLNHKPSQSLSDWLQREQVPLIYGVDTRALVTHLRTYGSQLGWVGAQPAPPEANSEVLDSWAAIQAVAVKAPTPFIGRGPRTARRFSVVAYDFGSKTSMLQLLWQAGADILVVPPDHPVDAICADGVFLSNGPGDPSVVPIDGLKKLLGRVPIFGICLGHQLLARALGASTYKLPFGHRGVNHPVLEHSTGKVLTTVQNHGYAVGELPAGVEVTHTHLNDGSVEGIAVPDLYAFSVQFHPEAAPGPHDTHALFWRFGDLCLEARQ